MEADNQPLTEINSTVSFPSHSTPWGSLLPSWTRNGVKTSNGPCILWVTAQRSRIVFKIHPGWLCTSFHPKCALNFPVSRPGVSNPFFSFLQLCFSSSRSVLLSQLFPGGHLSSTQQRLLCLGAFPLKAPFTTKHLPWKDTMMNCSLGYGLKIQFPDSLIFFNFFFLSSKSHFTFFHSVVHTDQGYVFKAHSPSDF